MASRRQPASAAADGRAEQGVQGFLRQHRVGAGRAAQVSSLPDGVLLHPPPGRLGARFLSPSRDGRAGPEMNPGPFYDVVTVEITKFVVKPPAGSTPGSSARATARNGAVDLRK